MRLDFYNKYIKMENEPKSPVGIVTGPRPGIFAPDDPNDTYCQMPSSPIKIDENKLSNRLT